MSRIVYNAETQEVSVDSGWVEVYPTQEELDAEAATKEAQRITRIKAEFDNQHSVNKVLLKIGFLQENRIRVLEGKPEITASQFRTWVENQID